jgi:hypothetical protein
MRQVLRPHPSSRSAAGIGVEAQVSRQQATLTLHYIVTGDNLLLPPLAAPERSDELWRHTCFEVFVRAASDASYYEFNFAPSTQWAAYRFSGYRAGMSVAELIRAPALKIKSAGGRFELLASVALDGLADPDSSWKIGLSAVVEHVSGDLSYWALAHLASKADFHHPDCFSLELPAA